MARKKVEKTKKQAAINNFPRKGAKIKQRRWSDREIEEALLRNFGIISYAAKELGCSYSALWKRVHATEELLAAKERAEEKILDIAEAQLFKNIKEGKEASLFFFLKCRGKHRGYVEKHQVENLGDIKIKIVHEDGKKKD